MADPILRENFFRIQRFMAENLLLSTDFKFIEADVPVATYSFPIQHGLSFVPTDIIPLAAEGDNNFYFNTAETDRDNVYVATHGPVRLRFLVGRFKQTGRRVLKDTKLPFVAPGIVSQGSGTISGGGSDGWAFIQDGGRNPSNPLQLTANVRTVLPNDQAGPLTNYTNAPANASSWWDAINYKFWPSKAGEFYTFKLNFQLAPTINNKNVFVETNIGTGNAPYATTNYLTRGAGVINRFSLSIPMAAGNAAFSNGIQFTVMCDCDAQVSNINLTVIRDFHL